MKIKIKTPAKINLTLKVGKLRDDGFHPIESIMQSINLFDFLTVELVQNHNEIRLSGTSNEIPYDEKNIVYCAAELFFKTLGKECGVEIFIEKNIPVCAGLAGGSTNAAGAVYALNRLLNEPFSRAELHKMCEKLGSDLNFCLEGGRQKCLGRGEILEKLPFAEFPVTLIKPKNLTISTKEAYKKFDELIEISNFANDLEFALLPHYKKLQELHDKGFQMSGSGPSFFIIEEKLPAGLIKNTADYDEVSERDKNKVFNFRANESKERSSYEIFEGLKALPYGVCEA